MDAYGDLFGETFQGQSLRLSITAPSLIRAAPARRPPLYQFTCGADGEGPNSGLMIDKNDDLFGEAWSTYTGTGGIVFELPKTASGYASSLTTLATGTGGSGYSGGLVTDSAGDIFAVGITGGIFEIAKTVSGYAGSTELPDSPYVSDLTVDSSCDLFGFW
jgi:hypothetical protein